MISNWTASSQIIGIPREQKIEVVKTLEAYPYALKEIDLTNELLSSCKRSIELYKENLELKDKQIALLQADIKNLEEQKRLYNKQVKKHKLDKLKIGGLGVLGILAAILLGN